MLKKNLQKTHSNKSIWQTLGNLRDLFIKTFKEKSTLSSHSKSLVIGIGSEVWTLEVPIQQSAFGVLSMMMKTGMYIKSITKSARQLTITLESLTQKQLLQIYLPLMETQVELSGLKNLQQEEYISHQQIKRRELISIVGLDLELRKLQKNLKSSQDMLYSKSLIELLMNIKQMKIWDHRRYLYSLHVQNSSENLKPIVGKKRVLPKQ